MKFTKTELLKIYVAMSNSYDLACFLNQSVSNEFRELMEKIKLAILNEKKTH